MSSANAQVVISHQGCLQCGWKPHTCVLMLNLYIITHRTRAQRAKARTRTHTRMRIARRPLHGRVCSHKQTLGNKTSRPHDHNDDDDAEEDDVDNCVLDTRARTHISLVACLQHDTRTCVHVCVLLSVQPLAGGRQQGGIEHAASLSPLTVSRASSPVLEHAYTHISQYAHALRADFLWALTSHAMLFSAVWHRKHVTRHQD